MLKKFSDRLYADLNRDLTALALEEQQPVKKLERSVHTCVKCLHKLKEFCKAHEPTDQEEEIAFFKGVKPRFKALLIFNQSLLNLEIRKPVCEGESMIDFLRNEVRILQHFFECNLTFYHYVRSEATYLDDRYFVRGQYHVHLDPDQSFVDHDPSFSTTHDHKLAQVIANQLLQEHLENEISKSHMRESTFHGDTDLKELQWKQTKVALIEMIYSWHATDAFGKMNLKSLAKFIEKVFNVQLGNFYDTFDWLCGRPCPTVYIDEMREAFLLRVQKKLK